MKYFFILAAIIVISCCSLVSAQSGTAKPSRTPPPPRPLAPPLSPVDAGTVTGWTYRNSYFGFQLTIPPGWIVHGKAAKEELSAKGRKARRPEDVKDQAAAQASRDRTSNLLTISKLPFGTQGEFNAVFMCMVEALPLSTTREAYMDDMKAQLKQTTEPITVLEEGKVETLGGVPFSTLITLTEEPGAEPVKQKYYLTLKKGYALLFITTMLSESDLDILDWIRDSIQFNDKPRSTGSDNWSKTKFEQLSFVSN